MLRKLSRAFGRAEVLRDRDLTDADRRMLDERAQRDALMAKVATARGKREELAASLEEKADRLARKHLIKFTTRTNPAYEVNWHHDKLGEVLDRFTAPADDPNALTRVMLFMPPRHGKTELASRRLPPFIFGKDPDAQVIATSYGADLAGSINRDVQRIMDSPTYHRLFPDTRLSGTNVRNAAQGNWLRNADMFEIVGRRGYYRSSGIGGAITGYGMTYGLIDDPIKNRKEAESQTFRDELWGWFQSTFYTRLEKHARILITLTRWTDDDLAGRLLKLAKEDPEADQWEVFDLAALCERDKAPAWDPRQEGEALWRNKYDEKALKRIRIILGSYQFASLFQQRPQPREGGIFKRQWWRYYDTLPDISKADDCASSYDMAFKSGDENDYVGGGVGWKFGADIYIGELWKEHLSFTESCKAIEAQRTKYPSVAAQLVEDAANGPAVVDTLRHKVPGLVLVPTMGGKLARAHACEPYVEAGNVLLPNPYDKEGQPIPERAWVLKFVENAAVFPKVDHDDDIDAFTQLVIKLMGHAAAFLDYLKMMKQAAEETASRPPDPPIDPNVPPAPLSSVRERRRSA